MLLGWYIEDDDEMVYADIESLATGDPLSERDAIMLGGSADVELREDLFTQHRAPAEDFNIMDFSDIAVPKREQRDKEKYFQTFLNDIPLSARLIAICAELGCTRRDFATKALREAADAYDKWKSNGKSST